MKKGNLIFNFRPKSIPGFSINRKVVAETITTKTDINGITNIKSFILYSLNSIGLIIVKITYKTTP